MRLFFITLICLSLTACASQEQMDIKMGKGCVAGVNALLEDQGKEIGKIKVQRYADEQAEGGLHRRITLEVIEKDGWLELEKEYSCLFLEEWSAFKISHRALMIQVQIEDQLYGKKDGEILGDLEDFLKLTRVTDKAMGQAP